METVMSTAWIQGIGPDPPLLWTLILPNTLKRGQTCSLTCPEVCVPRSWVPSPRTRALRSALCRRVCPRSAWPLEDLAPCSLFVPVLWFSLLFGACPTCVLSRRGLVAIHLEIIIDLHPSRNITPSVKNGTVPLKDLGPTRCIFFITHIWDR